MAAREKVMHQLDVVVNFAVEDDEDIALLVGHRLAARGGGIDDREPPAAEKNVTGFARELLSEAEAAVPAVEQQIPIIIGPRDAVSSRSSLAAAPGPMDR